jgi:protoporphyrinogen oxidase
MFSTNNYDIIIVGGGISGLFLASKLSDTDLSILLVEANDRWGGRVHTVKKQKQVFECGAARFHINHTKLLSLLYELNLQESIFELSSTIKHILRGKGRNYPYQTENKLDSEELLIQSVKLQSEQKVNLQNITMFQYLIQLYDFETALFIKDSFGYDSEFLELNAEAALEMFSEDLFSENKYYVLGGGLSQVVDATLTKLKTKSNVTLKLSSPVTDVSETQITVNKEIYYFNRLVLTVPPSALMKFPLIKETQLLDSVKPIPLLRIYAKYPVKKGHVWFKNIKRTTTDNYLRHIIPIDYKTGLIMISYTDGFYTELWNHSYSCGEDVLIEHLHKEVKDVFGIEPPQPEFISFHLWTEGLHVWKPGSSIQAVTKRIINPYPSIFICGEGFSKKQGWIEGCLETCYDVLRELKLPGIDVIEESKNPNQTKPMKESKEPMIPFSKVKENNWVVFEHNAKKYVYDVSQWKDKHPGGSQNIEKAIQATQDYYGSKKGKSPTELFKEIGRHKSLPLFLEMKKEYVVKQGVLK